MNSDCKIRIGIIENELITKLTLSRCLKSDETELFYSASIEDFLSLRPQVIIASASVISGEALTVFSKTHFAEENPLLISTSWSKQDTFETTDYPNRIFLLKPFISTELNTIIKKSLALSSVF